ncbi:SDR family oxidoreductase [Niveispirillum sp. KHB5.9]|uniref:SDR family oxidoreductase n=1 Tax=Niveispirillum sp. KHB5.9 TaxID=3400269 RepID=UPI003A83AC52
MVTDLFSLAGKKALVTGGAQGLGRMIAEGLLRAGADVAITSRKPDICAQAAAEMAALGPCLALPADLSTPEAAVDLADRYRQAAGGLDILVNNAGKTWGAPIESFPDKAWASVMAVNVQTPFKLVQQFLSELTASGLGGDPARIINIGSVAGVAIELLQAYSYSASKAAIHQLSRQLAKDLADRNITVNAVLPGFFPTSMTAHLRDADDAPTGALQGHIPLRRLGRPDDIAGIVVFLCSRAGAYVTGAEIPVDGGIVGCR